MSTPAGGTGKSGSGKDKPNASNGSVGVGINYECRNIPLFHGAVDDDVEEFLGTFERIATANGWGFEKMAMVLPAYLRGKAAEDWEALELEVKTEYKDLREALLAKLAPTEVTSQYSLRLRGRKQEFGESVVKFARSVQKLVRKAYPDMDTKTKERIAKDHFLNGLRMDLKRLTMTSSPTTFDAAVARACEQECFVRIERGEDPAPDPAAVHAIVDDQQRLERRFEKLEDHLVKILEQTNRTLNTLQSQNQYPVSTFIPNSRPRGFSRGPNMGTRGWTDRSGSESRTRFANNAAPICDFCGRRGHLKFNCRDRARSFEAREPRRQNFTPNPTPRRVNFRPDIDRLTNLQQRTSYTGSSTVMGTRNDAPDRGRTFHEHDNPNSVNNSAELSTLRTELESLRTQNMRMAERILSSEAASQYGGAASTSSAFTNMLETDQGDRYHQSNISEPKVNSMKQLADSKSDTMEITAITTDVPGDSTSDCCLETRSDMSKFEYAARLKNLSNRAATRRPMNPVAAQISNIASQLTGTRTDTNEVAYVTHPTFDDIETLEEDCVSLTEISPDVDVIDEFSSAQDTINYELESLFNPEINDDHRTELVSDSVTLQDFSLMEVTPVATISKCLSNNQRDANNEGECSFASEMTERPNTDSVYYKEPTSRECGRQSNKVSLSRDQVMQMCYRTIPNGEYQIMVGTVEPDYLFMATLVSEIQEVDNIVEKSKQWLPYVIRLAQPEVGQLCLLRQDTFLCRVLIVHIYGDEACVELLDYGGMFYVNHSELCEFRSSYPICVDTPRLGLKFILINQKLPIDHVTEILTQHIDKPLTVKIEFSQNDYHYVKVDFRKYRLGGWFTGEDDIHPMRCLDCQGLDVYFKFSHATHCNLNRHAYATGFCLNCQARTRIRMIGDEIGVDVQFPVYRYLTFPCNFDTDKNSQKLVQSVPRYMQYVGEPNSIDCENIFELNMITACETVIPFCGRDNYFSNMYPATILIDSVYYQCNEQYYAYQKCIFADDSGAAASIMRMSNPIKMKAKAKLAVQKAFLQDEWRNSSARIFYLRKANITKFTQHPHLRTWLLGTENNILAEASQDKFWGCGIQLLSPDIYDTSKWTGANEMGKILMQLREFLRSQQDPQATPAEVSAIKTNTNPMPIIYGTLEGECPIELLVDSGCNISILSSRLLRRTSKFASRKPSADTVSRKARSITGQSLVLLDEVSVSIQLGSSSFIHEFFVVESSPYDGILGTDFMKSFNIKLDLGSGRLVADEISLSLWPKEFSGQALMLAAEDTVLPAWSEIIFGGLISTTAKCSNLLLEGCDHLPESHGIFVARSLLTSKGLPMPVRAVNFRNEPLTIPKYFCLGTLTEVTECDESGNYINYIVEECGANDTSFIHEIDLRRSCLTESEKTELLQLCLEFKDIFSHGEFDLGRTSVVQHTINTGDNTPIKQRPYKIPEALNDDVNRQLKEMESHGIIRPSASPWCSPIVVVKKKSGQNRICVDYRKLNAVTKSDVFPLPRIDSILAKLGQAVIFSSLDLASGYHQIEVAEEDKEKTAFSPGDDLFEYNFMPFGLKCAPATFQRALQFVLAGSDACYVYIDDILIASPNGFSTHLTDIRNIFERLRFANLKLKPKKCTFASTDVGFLGHLVSKDGIMPDAEKIMAVRDFPVPTKVKDLKSFLGLCSYYRKFVKDFAKIAQPLHHLLKKNIAFVWTPECEEAFQGLKQCLVTAPVLMYPDYSEDFILSTDASDCGLGAILSQKLDSVEKPIAYASRSLLPAEKNYSTTEKEALAAVWGITYFLEYLYGRHFILVTDHQALKWLMNIKNPAGRLARWSLLLQEFDYEIAYRPGKCNNADGLSRMPVESEDVECHPIDRFEEDLLCPLLSVDEGILDGEVAHDDFTVEVDPIYSNWYPQCKFPNGNDINPVNCPAVSAISTLRDTSMPNSETCAENEPDGRDVTSSYFIEQGAQSWQRLKAEQRKDPELFPIIKFLECGEITEETDSSLPIDAERFLLVNEVLHHMYREQSKARRPEFYMQVVIPTSMQSELLEAMHDDVLSGHLGFTRTYHKIRQRYFFPNMYHQIFEWCKNCTSCQTRKPPHSYQVAPLQPIIAVEPFEICVVDCLGPLPTAENAHNYIVLFVDHFTKWPEAFSTENITAVTIAKLFIEQIVCKHSAPKCLLSDRGPCFISALVQTVCDMMNTRKLYSTAYRPQTQGLVERMNRSLLEMISHYVSSHQKDWPNCLEYILFAYRTTVHETTGIEPFTLMYGRQARLPVDVMLQPPITAGKEVQSYLKTVSAKLAEARQVANANATKARDRQKETHDQKVSKNNFSVGDQVWLLNTAVPKSKSKKLLHKWTGPYVVLEQLPSNNIRIRLCKGEDRDMVVHQKRCKRCHNTYDEEDINSSDPDNDFMPVLSGSDIESATSAVTLRSLSPIPESAGVEQAQLTPNNCPAAEVSTNLRELPTENSSRPEIQAPFPAWHGRLRHNRINLYQMLVMLLLVGLVCSNRDDSPTAPPTSNLTINNTVGVKLNPRYGVLFREIGHIDNSQDFLVHYFIIPLRVEIHKPTPLWTCDPLKLNGSAGLYRTAKVLCNSLIKLNRTSQQSYIKVKEKLNKLLGDMDYFQFGYSDNPSHARKGFGKKRNIIKGFVCLLESIFGGCNTDPTDIKALKRALRSMSTRTDHTAQQVVSINGRLISMAKLTSSGFRNSERKFSAIASSLQHISAFQRNLNRHFSQMSETLEAAFRTTQYSIHFTSELHKWNALMLEWYEQLEEAYLILEAIMRMEDGKLSPIIVPPHVLYPLLQQMQLKLSPFRSNLMYPQSQLNQYYLLPLVKAAYWSGKSLILKLHFPVSHTDMLFQAWSVTFAQTKLPDNHAYIQLSSPYDTIAINGDASHYILLTRSELTSCSGNTIKQCRNVWPVLPINRKSCLFSLFMMRKHSEINSICHVTLSQYLNPIQNFEIANGLWYSAVSEGDWRLFCKNSTPRKVSPCLHCIIKLPCGCGLSMTKETLPIRYHGCQKGEFQEAYSFNPFSSLNMLDAAENISALQLFDKPLNLSGIPSMDNLLNGLESDLRDSSTVALNFSKFVTNVQKKNKVFLSTDLRLSNYVQGSIDDLKQASSTSNIITWVLVAGEILLAFTVATLFTINYLKSMFPNQGVILQPVPGAPQSDPAKSPHCFKKRTTDNSQKSTENPDTVLSKPTELSRKQSYTTRLHQLETGV